MAAIKYTVTDNYGGSKVSLAADLQGKVTLGQLLEFTKKSLIEISKQALAEEQARGFDKNPVTVVDRSTTKSIEQVNPLGRIQFFTRADIGELIIEAYDTVLRLSKIVSGHYYDSHQVLHNDVLVATNRGELARYLKTAKTFVNDYWAIANSTPYARRLETLGVSAKGTKPKRKEKRYRNRKRGGGKIRMTKPPNGAYQLSYQSLKSRIGKFVFVRFKFVPGSELKLSGDFKTGNSNQTGRPYLYPVITIANIQGGVQ
ncbi:MAG: hypothetical protein VKL41_05095 [Snowella sp.]|nr:hypothetical protein [Snowella sp.]